MSSLSLAGQSISNVRKIKVEDLLDEAEMYYQVRFSYSKDIVPYDHVIDITDTTSSLQELLEVLESQTGIIYLRKGSRVVLNYDPDKITVSTQVTEDVDPIGDEMTLPEQEVLVDETIVSEERNRGNLVVLAPITRINDPTFHDEVHSEQQYQADLARLETDKRPDLMQFTLLPLPHSAEQKSNTDYHVSLNAFLGFNGGIEGVELGLLLNGIRNDVFGIQLAGLGNYVEGNVQGGQAAGFFNYNRGIVRGIQMAGFANMNDQADALQMAGFFNVNQRISRGLQMAGFFNAGRHISGGQLAGFFNLSLGDLNVQASGFCNVAENVQTQLSGLVNVAKHVDYLQLGLVNIADSVSGASIGLLNIIRKGYNAVELSGSDALYGNIGLKLGNKHFYNVFQLGSNFQRNLDNTGLTWGLGYGFGFFVPLSPVVKFNPELLAIHVQETSIRNLQMNLLNQAKFLFHFSADRKGAMEYFAGPVLNVSVSKIYDEDRQTYGSQIAPYALWENTDFSGFNPITTKLWIGFSAGIRI